MNWKGEEMNSTEVGKILRTMEALFQNFKVDNVMDAMAAWEWALKDYDYNRVGEALQTYIRTEGSNFAPSASKLISLINIDREMTMPTEQEAWAMVRKAVQSLDWFNPQKEFDKLPEVVQKAVINPATLKEWAMTEGDIEQVIGSNFMRTYRQVVQRELTEEKLPDSVRERIEQARQNLLDNGRLGIEG